MPTSLISYAGSADDLDLGEVESIIGALAWHAYFVSVQKKTRLAAINFIIGREMMDAQVTCSSSVALQVQKRHANTQRGFYCPIPGHDKSKGQDSKAISTLMAGFKKVSHSSFSLYSLQQCGMVF